MCLDRMGPVRFEAGRPREVDVRPHPHIGLATLMSLSGEPLGRRFLDRNFVSSSRERIERAKSDWRAGRIELPDFDDREWVPLPGDPPPPAAPMS